MSLCNCAFAGNPLEKIIGGSVTNTKTHPHQLSLQIASTGQHICGASIIHNKWFLTAAHCVEQYRYVFCHCVTPADDTLR